MRWSVTDPLRHRAFLWGIASVLAVGLGPVGCDGARDVQPFQVRDSAGIQIVESFRPAWEEGAGWRVGPEPALRLGVVDGDPAQQFDDIVGLVRSRDGSVAVADGGSQEVRFFDPAGNLTVIVGGSGEGPGEFTGLSGLGSGPGGSIWAYDFYLRRITWLNGAGEVEGLVPLGLEPPVLNPVGPLSDGTFALKQLWGATQVSEATATGLRRDPVAFVRFDEQGTLVDTLGLFPGREVFLIDENGRGVMSTPPFALNSVGSVWQGRAVVGTQDSFQLLELGPAGEVTREVRIPGWNLSLDPGEMEAYVQLRLQDVPAERRPAVRQELEAMPVPSTKPAYGQLLSDEPGNLWVGEWTIPPGIPQRWNVLDRAGGWLGEVVMPGRFLPFAIGEDWVLGVERDEMDVQYVVLYPLLKEGARE